MKEITLELFMNIMSNSHIATIILGRIPHYHFEVLRRTVYYRRLFQVIDGVSINHGITENILYETRIYRRFGDYYPYIADIEHLRYQWKLSYMNIFRAHFQCSSNACIRYLYSNKSNYNDFIMNYIRFIYIMTNEKTKKHITNYYLSDMVIFLLHYKKELRQTNLIELIKNHSDNYEKQYLWNHLI